MKAKLENLVFGFLEKLSSRITVRIYFEYIILAYVGAFVLVVYYLFGLASFERELIHSDLFSTLAAVVSFLLTCLWVTLSHYHVDLNIKKNHRWIYVWAGVLALELFLSAAVYVSPLALGASVGFLSGMIIVYYLQKQIQKHCLYYPD